MQADEVLALNSKREFVIIQDKRKDGEIWVSLKQQEVRSSTGNRTLVPCNPSGPGVCTAADAPSMMLLSQECC
jgi:hypothetical protein